MRRALALIFTFSAGAAAAEDMTSMPEPVMEITVMPEPEPPPKLGVINGTLGKRPQMWETFDFSVGAFDASAWVDMRDEQVAFHLMGYVPKEPNERRYRIFIEGRFGAALTVGPAQEPVMIEIYRGESRDGARLSSARHGAKLVIDSIGPSAEGSYLRHITGHASAKLCPKAWAFKACQDLVVTFDSDVQIGSDIVVN